MNDGKARIYNLIIVDESGSMSHLREATLSGINETISTIRSAQEEFMTTQEHTLTLVTFDSGSNRPDVRTMIDNQPISGVIDFKDYMPNGCTPLYDAMGQSLTLLHREQSNNVSKKEQIITEIPFTKEDGICKVKCQINGLPLHFVFDTGASDVTLSMVEATFMMKNGYLSKNDVIGNQRYMDANGDVNVGTVINIKNVNFGGLDLNNIRASVVRNQKAPSYSAKVFSQDLAK